LQWRRTIAIVTTHSKRPDGQSVRARGGFAEAKMVQTTNRFFDEVARLMNDAAGVAQGVRREFETLFRSQAERILRDLDVVKREDFEAVKEMARLAREENEALRARVAALEATLGKTETKPETKTEMPSPAGGAPGSANPGSV
jgi:BMFP domain-containing protein YqiC